MNSILIYGYGREGKSTEKFFQNAYPEIKISIFDQKTHPTEPEWDKYDLIFCTPGIDPHSLPKEHQFKVTNQINWFLNNLAEEERKKVIGITGSKGKTTTTLALTNWLNHIGLNVVCAGNIGHPILEIFNDFKAKKYDYIVLEMSSYQLEILQKSPHIAVFLGLFPDHLDRHKTLQNYGRAKSQLWGHQNTEDYCITTPLGKSTIDTFPTKAKIQETQSLSTEAILENHIFMAEHFRSNLGIIPAVTEIIGKKFTHQDFLESLETLQLPEHRLEFVNTKQGISFFNDAIATNPEAVIAAIKFFNKKLGTLILGGTDGGGSFDILFETLDTVSPETTTILTESPVAKKIKETFPKRDFVITNNLEEAVSKALSLTPSGKVCLLSPAGKSFDQYPNYETKGRHFKTLVSQL